MLLPLAAALTAVLALSAAPSVALGPNGRPDQMGMLTIDGATTSGLHVRWAPVDGATSYIVEVSTNERLTDRREVSQVQANDAWVNGLAPGQMYCFSVHGVNDKGHGKRGNKSCHPTIVAQGSVAGPVYRVMTYNICSVTCGGWKHRRGGAATLVRAADADVVGLQEDRNRLPKLLKGSLKKAVHKGINTLLYRPTRFSVARKGVIKLKADRRNAVWAELVDHAAGGKHVIFVDTHLTDGKNNDAKRRVNMNRLLAGMAKVNRGGLPVVYLGDLNSNRRRPNDVPAEEFKKIGFYDSFDLAQSLLRPNYSSFGGFSSQPQMSQLYGDHSDHFFVKANASRVLSWANAGWIGDNQLLPKPSDHNPLLIAVQVS